MNNRQYFAKTNRWVIKAGSSLLTNQGRGLDSQLIASWVSQIAKLRKDGVNEIILVSSGAVAEGMCRLGWTKRPSALHDLQAAAAVGQMGLIQAYESQFQKHDLHTAQILLTHDDIADRKRYINARSTLRTLLRLGVIPVVNENDTVAVDEIRFGDNDTLGALVANLVEADLFVILTDQEGMFDKDPRVNSDAKMIHEAQAGDSKLEHMAAGGEAGSLGRGGMVTKVRAANWAARSGTATIIAGGRQHDVLQCIRHGDAVGTLVLPGQEPLAARKQWLAGHLQVRGKLQLDNGAVKVLRDSGKSLLAIGVTKVEGQFGRGEVVVCVDPEGREIARGLINYSAQETQKIMRQPSSKISEILGYVDEPELIHRDNLVML